MTPKRRLEDEYEKINTIGRGSYGVVYKVRRRASGDIAALKRVRLNPGVISWEGGIPSSSLREIAALKNLKHPNILQLHDIIHTGTSLYLVFEHLDQDLKKTLQATQSGFCVKVARNFMWQLLQAISFCHARRILHRDIKLQNLLVNKDGTIKLADFGLARGMAMPLKVYTKDVVTLWYRAPELLLGSEIYGPAIDIWSLGGVFYEILTKRPLFAGDSEIDQLLKIFQILGTPNESQWEGISNLPYYKTSFPSWSCKDLDRVFDVGCPHVPNLLKQMLIYNPQKRVSARDALKHPFFENLNKRPTLRDIQNPLRNDLP
jgi:serine/threonine protein kinase